VSVLERAIELHTVLVTVRQIVLDKSLPDDVQELHALVGNAVESACAIAGITYADLSPSYYVVLKVGAVMGGPKVICGRYTVDLRQALQQRAQLLRGKAAGWPGLREAWIDMLCTPLQRRTTPGTHVHSPGSTRADAAAEVDAAWEYYRAAREERAARGE